MTAIELLTEYLDQERNNVFHTAANFHMDSPKRGCEREFQAALERVEALEQIMEKLGG